MPDKLPVLRKYPYAPHPFVLTPPLDGRTVLPPGAALDIDLTLIGPGLKYLSHFLVVFETMGRRGRYGGTFRLKAAVRRSDCAPHAACSEPLIYDGLTRKLLAVPAPWTPPTEPDRVSRLQLDFLTPLRMRTAGRYNARPDFVAIVHALLRRIHLLSALYGSGDGDTAWMKPLLRIADQAQTVRSEFSLFRWSRMSCRQRRLVDMDGVLGSLEVGGSLGPLVPYLRMGEFVHVGSGTAMGLGRYAFRILE
jgi:hypothetical protein